MEKYEHTIRHTPEFMTRLDELTGKVLGCWCKMPGESKKTCHGDVLVKIWKEYFPDHDVVPELWRTHYFPEGKNDKKMKVLRMKKRKASVDKKKPAKKTQKISEKI